ncbi:hypothetical protein RFEPED_0362 [Rickettsia felis str. Pedreira]|uniref:Uncharacterized protein n=1 Tax=Rickettsia felis str. Pedreira TaxID=1359196 RepID=A0A0F3MQN8_RICFI|nr:hypothetical protein RFEPED_0362 [Rickettsia felis str. Pedreira]
MSLCGHQIVIARSEATWQSHEIILLRLLRQLLCNFLAMTDKADPRGQCPLAMTLIINKEYFE